MTARRILLSAALAALLLCVGAVPAVPETANAASARQDRLERSIVRKVNAIRRQRGLRRLRTSRALARAADGHSLEQLRANVVSHTSPDGTPMGRRVRRFVRARAVGETIAWVSRRTRRQSAVIVSGWMRSPSHRRALLSSRFRRVGLGRRTGSLGRGATVLTTLNLASAR